MQEKNNIEPAISVVIANLVGLNRKSDEWVYNLQKEVVLGFSPYADEVSGLIDKADRRWYETDITYSFLCSLLIIHLLI
ncbi:MAG: hypothetical protein MRQ13_03340 [Candidatus Midichloria sp.]|nr:hypothetical protein [Candidatus Midichloria sp.]